MEFTLQFFVRSTSSETFVRFSLNFTQLFLSVRRCAKPVTQLHAHSRSRLSFDVMGSCSGGFSCPSHSRLVQWKTCFTYAYRRKSTSEIDRPSYLIFDVHHHLEDHVKASSNYVHGNKMPRAGVTFFTYAYIGIT